MANSLNLLQLKHLEICLVNFNLNDDILLTREQIGTALEYSNPDASLSMIHKRHRDRLEPLSVVTKLLSTDGKEYETTLYTQRGVMEICRWSNRPKDNQFMDWVWDIVEKYRNHELTSMKQIDITPITEAITSMSQAIITLTANIAAMQQDIQDLKQSQRNRYLLEKRYPSAWYKKMAPKYKMLMEYFHCSRNELYSSIYKELEDTYDVDVNQLYEDYCYENRLSKEECYVMDAIEHDTRLRNALTLLIDSSLVKYGLKTEDKIKNFKRETLFDRKP